MRFTHSVMLFSGVMTASRCHAPIVQPASKTMRGTKASRKRAGLPFTVPHSLFPGAGFSHYLRPLRNLPANEVGELARRERHWLRADLADLRLHVGILQRQHDRVVELGDDV